MTKSKKPPTNGALPPPGVIEPQMLYTLDEVKARTGFGDAAMRTARRAGLRVVYCNKRGFVKGADMIDYIEANGRDDTDL